MFARSKRIMVLNVFGKKCTARCCQDKKPGQTSEKTSHGSMDRKGENVECGKQNRAHACQRKVETTEVGARNCISFPCGVVELRIRELAQARLNVSLRQPRS